MNLTFKSLPKLIVLTCALGCVATVGAAAADSAPQSSEKTSASSPAGIWKWTQQVRDGSSWEQSLKLEYARGKLTGSLLPAEAAWGQTPEVPISDATFNEGVVALTVRREFNGNSVAIKYEGRLSGDTITGTTERPSRDGGPAQKRDWSAARVQ
jgi:hypothetical protein